MTAGNPTPIRRGKTRGQTMVEFALVLPVFLLMLFGIFEGGRLAFSYVNVNHAVQEGARHAALRSTSNTGSVESKVQSAASPLTVSGIVVSVSGGKPFNARAAGDTVSVQAQYTFTPVVSMVFGSGSISLSAKSAVTVE